MDTQQIDRLLKRKARGARLTRIGLYAVAVVLCLALLGGITAGAVYAVRRAAAQPGSKPSVSDPGPTEPSPTEPVPTEPAPTEPDPTESAPTEPDPTGPASIAHTLQLVWFGEVPEQPWRVGVTVVHGEQQTGAFSLTAENGWKHTWTDTVSAAELTLLGEFPEGMTGAVSVNGENFTLSVTYEPPVDPTVEPTQPEADPLPGQLPNTGLSTLPAVVLLVLGAALLAAGIRQKSSVCNTHS